MAGRFKYRGKLVKLQHLYQSMRGKLLPNGAQLNCKQKKKKRKDIYKYIFLVVVGGAIHW